MPKGWDPTVSVDPLFQVFTDVKSNDHADLIYPMYSLWAVGMPVPGVDFCNFAELRSGEKAPKGLGTSSFTPNRFTEWLQVLYRAALYLHPFTLPVQMKNKVKPGVASFVPGSLWGERSTGPIESKVMVVGKHPGREESQTGMNFSGPTSSDLVKALNELGVEDSDSWYMTNVVKFPHLDSKAGVTLPAQWIKDCLPLLHQEFRLVKPEYLLCLGDDATKAILGRKYNTANTSGRVIELTIPRHEFLSEEPNYHVIKVMTCMHPARVARQPDLYPQFIGSLRLFVGLTRGESIGKEETDLIRYELYDEQSLSNLVNQILSTKADLFAVDCEWQGSYPTDKDAYLRTVQFSWANKTAAIIVVRDAKGKPFDGDWVTQLKRLLKSTPNRKVRVAGHQFRADLPWLMHAGIDLRPEYAAPEDDDNPDGVTRLYGWQKTATEGGIDTLLAVHAWQETHPLGLEACSSQLLGAPRYDIPLEEWKDEYCKLKKMKKTELPGYGEFPDEILHPYGLYDADVSWRLADKINQQGGMLDVDRYGNNCRQAFWISMRAAPAFLEMEMEGVAIDRKRAEELTDVYMAVRETRLKELREAIKWPTFRPTSPRDRLELLFGEKYNGTPNKYKIRPNGAKSLYLQPIKSTGKRSMLWAKILEKARQDPSILDNASPSTDKECMGILISSIPTDDWRYDIVMTLKDISFLNQLLRTVLRPPKLVAPMSSLASTGDEDYDFDEDEMVDTDEGGNRVFDEGIISKLHDDDRIRPHFSQTAETGRAKCSKPNLQNLSKRREPDYERIAGDLYRYSLRSIFVPSPGHVLIEADYSAAEVAGVAWMSGDPALIEHARRSALPEDHPDYFDIHSNIAVRAFQLNCPPTKKGLKSIHKIALRTAAKTVFFGYLYGQGAEAAARNARMEGAKVTTDDAQMLINSLSDTYPLLASYFEYCRESVRDPMWLQNCFGRYRRFSPSFDRQVVGEMERQGMNFPY